MTKKQIARQIAEVTDVPQTEVRRIVQLALDGIAEAIVTEGGIELRNFGVFEVRTRASRVGTNPRSGAKVEVPPRNTVVFRPGKELLDRVRGLAVEESAILAPETGEEELVRFESVA